MSHKFWFRALGVFLTISLMWGISEYNKAYDLEIATENQYRRSLADFVSNLDGLETTVAKSRAAGTPTQQVSLFSQSWHQSEIAVKDLSLLPAEKLGLNYIDQFLNQVGEFSKIVTQQIAKGKSLSTDQETILSQMHERLIAVNTDVQEFYNNLNTESIAWLDESAGQASWYYKEISPPSVAPASAQGEEGQAPKPGSIRSSLEQLDASLQKLPPFSYSGQTETHSVPEPLGLPEITVTEEEAKTIATDFLRTVGYPDASPQSAGTSNGSFGGYIFKYESTTLDICKKGGVVTLFRDERPLGLQELTLEQTVNKAMSTLKTLGWEDFVETSTEDFGGIIQLEVINEPGSIRIYPDKIRLTVGKDNGQITGYDATPYWLFHHERNFDKKISLTQAKDKLRPEMKIKETRLTVISLPGWEEAYCYEFRASNQDEDFLIYINATDGSEEKIQRVILTPRGEFLQ